MKAELRRWAALWSCVWSSATLLLLTAGFIGALVVAGTPVHRAIAIILAACAAVNAGLLRHFVMERRLRFPTSAHLLRHHRGRVIHRGN